MYKEHFLAKLIVHTTWQHCHMGIVVSHSACNKHAKTFTLQLTIIAAKIASTVYIKYSVIMQPISWDQIE